MTEQNFWIVGVILKFIGGVFLLLTALFAFLASLNNEKTEKTKAWFQKKWEVLNKSSWFQMPEMIISFILNAEKKISNYLVISIEKNLSKRLLFLSAFLLFNSSVLILFGYKFVIISIIISIPIISMIVGKLSTYDAPWIYSALPIPEFLVLTFLVLPFILGAIFWFSIALNSSLTISIISTIISIPCFVVFINGIMTILEEINNNYSAEDTEELTFFIGLSVGISFSITFIAFLIGNLISDQSYVPQTFQMLISNVLLDGLTLFLTIKLLHWSLQKKSWTRIPFVILLDMIIAAILACLALYLGLAYTEQQLSLTEIVYILIGKSPSGEGFELGPLFWAMHTTFIPTLIYLLFIGIGYMGKLILTPIKWFLGKGQEHKSPLSLTSTLCGLLAAIFGLAGYATDGIDKHIEKTEKHQSISNTKSNL